VLGQAKVIRIILGLWRDRKDNDSFYRCMVRLGWEPPSVYEEGGFKTVLMKGKLVLKYDDVDLCGHTEKEWTLYRRTTTFKRRYLAKCYAYEDGLLIQEKLPQRCLGLEACTDAKRWAHRFRILDWGWNHTHRNGHPVFFDYDNMGYGWDAWKQRRLTKRRA